MIMILNIFCLQVTHELNALDNLHKVAASENLPKYDTALIVDALLESHSEVILLTGGNSNGRNNWSQFKQPHLKTTYIKARPFYKNKIVFLLKPGGLPNVPGNAH